MEQPTVLSVITASKLI